jgi:DNA-binding transcriptional MerR regulator
MLDLEKAMKKVPEKTYYRIGEVARLTGVKPYVLRFWESEFKAIVPPKSRSQQRMYRRRDIETILLIKHLLYEERFTIEGARKRVAELARGEGSSAQLPAVPAELARLRADLLDLRELLVSA